MCLFLDIFVPKVMKIYTFFLLNIRTNHMTDDDVARYFPYIFKSSFPKLTFRQIFSCVFWVGLKNNLMGVSDDFSDYYVIIELLNNEKSNETQIYKLRWGISEFVLLPIQSFFVHLCWVNSHFFPKRFVLFLFIFWLFNVQLVKRTQTGEFFSAWFTHVRDLAEK